MALLHGFGASGYRSLQRPIQRVAPLGKVNLVAGQNNAGKSNLLRFARQLLTEKARLVAPIGLDRPQPPDEWPFHFEVARFITDDGVSGLTVRQGVGGPPVYDTLQSLFEHPLLRDDDDLIWFRYTVQPTPSGRGGHAAFDPLWLANVQQNFAGDLQTVSLALGGTGGGSVGDDLGRTLQRWDPLDVLPPVQSVGAFRQIAAGEGDDVLTGTGLVKALQRLQNPPLATRKEDSLKFAAINDFLRTVLADGTARLDVPFDAAEIQVEQGDLALPLEHYGTGIHQVVILAAAASMYDDHLICMEEPEVHLHPLLQRKLVRYLAENTTNQYLIATHSAHLLDFERANVFHVQRSTDGTQVLRAGTPAKVSALCADLGYRPSDLLQANAVIWVEGPSDRIYLRHWIRLLDGELVEGTHFSIMFYGGRLLNHLTAHDPEVEDFISLRRLNRHIAIMIDSDKNNRNGKIGATKQRVQQEFAQSPSGFAWLTDGRTIENYVPVDQLRAGVALQAPQAVLDYDDSKWSDPLATTPETRIDKVRLAHDVCASWSDIEKRWRDLRVRVEAAVTFIREANGMDSV